MGRGSCGRNNDEAAFLPRVGLAPLNHPNFDRLHQYRSGLGRLAAQGNYRLGLNWTQWYYFPSQHISQIEDVDLKFLRRFIQQLKDGPRPTVKWYIEDSGNSDCSNRVHWQMIGLGGIL